VALDFLPFKVTLTPQWGLRAMFRDVVQTGIRSTLAQRDQLF
jgi:hypothetical protein